MARISWAARFDIGGDPNNDDIHIAWKYLYTAKDTWLGPTQNLGSIGSLYNLTMDPFEKYDMVFNGAMSSRMLKTSPGQYAGEDNGWALVADLSGDHRFRQVDREVSEHQAIPGRRIQRPGPRPSASGESGAAGRSEQGAAGKRRRRLSALCLIRLRNARAAS